MPISRNIVLETSSDSFSGGKLVSSNRWPETEDVEGLFQMEGTEYENVNLVYMPYCTSDAHMGAVTRDIGFPIEGEKTGWHDK